MRAYVVVSKSQASAVFYPGEQFSLSYELPGRAPILLMFKTHYQSHENFTSAVPTHLWIEARGEADSLNSALETFGNAILEISCLVALAANVSVGLPLPELVFENNAEAHEHEFLQIFHSNSSLQGVPGRRIDPDSLRSLIGAIGKHDDRARIQRAAAQYVEALENWTRGREISCLAHLWMGIEAISVAIFRQYCKNTAKTADEVAAEWQVAPKQLYAETRRRLIFKGDSAAYQKAKKVSDGFEHGFSDFGEMRKPAGDVLLTCARYLRHGIFEMLDLGEKARSVLLAADYELARGPLKLVRYLRGTLTGSVDELAAPDQTYPLMTWSTKITNVFVNDKGQLQFKAEDTIIPRLGASAKFIPRRVEVWDGCAIYEQPDILNRIQDADAQSDLGASTPSAEE